MPEHCRVEAQRSDLALAATSFFNVLKASRIAEADDVHTHIARDKQALAPPKERDLASTR